MSQAKIDFFPEWKIPNKKVKCSQDNEEKTEQQETKDILIKENNRNQEKGETKKGSSTYIDSKLNKEEEIQLNQELARAFLKQAEIARREKNSEKEIQMNQELATVCLEQAEIVQREKIWRCNQQYGRRNETIISDTA